MQESARLIVCSSSPVAELGADEAFSLIFGDDDTPLGDRWRVGWLVDWPDLLSDALAAYADETGMPVLFTEGAGDDDFVLAALHLPGTGPDDPALTVNCWLGPKAAREAGNDLGGYSPDAAHQLALCWSRAARRAADPGALAVALSREGLPAKDYLRLFLYGLGVPGIGADDLRLRFGLRGDVITPPDDPVDYQLLQLLL